MPKTVVTPELEEKVRQLRSEGKTIAQIKQETLLGAGTISALCRGIPKELGGNRDTAIKTVREVGFSDGTKARADQLQRMRLENEEMSMVAARQRIEDVLNESKEDKEQARESKQLSIQERRIALANLVKSQTSNILPPGPGHDGSNPETTELRGIIESLRAEVHASEIKRMADANAVLIKQIEQIQTDVTKNKSVENLYGLISKGLDKFDRFAEEIPKRNEIREIAMAYVQKQKPVTITLTSEREREEQLKKAALVFEQMAREKEAAAAAAPGPDCFGNFVLDLLPSGIRVLQAGCRKCERLLDCQAATPGFKQETTAPGGRGEVNYGKESK
jgi:hypothetical protein